MKHHNSGRTLAVNVQEKLWMMNKSKSPREILESTSKQMENLESDVVQLKVFMLKQQFNLKRIFQKRREEECSVGVGIREIR